jgi:hypothetical protein
VYPVSSLRPQRVLPGHAADLFKVPRLARVWVAARHTPAVAGTAAVAPLIGGGGSDIAVAPILTERVSGITACVDHESRFLLYIVKSICLI